VDALWLIIGKEVRRIETTIVVVGENQLRGVTWEALD